MRQQLSVEALKTEELSEAWALARASGTYANKDWWIAEGTEIISAGGGVLAARAMDGQLHGVATFQASREGTLVIPLLVTFEFSRCEPTRNALLNSLKRIATKLECTHVLAPLSGKFESRRGKHDCD